MPTAPNSKSSPRKPQGSKAARNIAPIANHLIKTYETLYKLGFLLNRKKSYIGDNETGFALSLGAIKRLREILNTWDGTDFLPKSLLSQIEEESLAQAMGQFISHSMLEFNADTLLKTARQLVDSIEDIDHNDDTELNLKKVMAVFKSPNEGKVKGLAPHITPMMLMRQLQKSVSLLKQRFQVELETIQTLRENNITKEDCLHVLAAPHLMEIKGRMLAAREIYSTHKCLKQLVKNDYKGVFHPKITLSRALEHLKQWAPGTPPRSFTVLDSPRHGKVPVLNEKLTEQLTIFRQCAAKALNAKCQDTTYEEKIENLKALLKEFYCEVEETEQEASSKSENSQEELTPEQKANQQKSVLGAEAVLKEETRIPAAAEPSSTDLNDASDMDLDLPDADEKPDIEIVDGDEEELESQKIDVKSLDKASKELEFLSFTYKTLRELDMTTQPPLIGRKNLEKATPLSVEELINFYQQKHEEASKELMQSLLFEKAIADYISHYVISVDQAKDLRGIFTTLQIDLTQAIDLYLMEAQSLIRKIKIIAAKQKIPVNAQEIATIMQPVETTYHLPFVEAVQHWTNYYLDVLKKYLLIIENKRQKVIDRQAVVEHISQLAPEPAISYMTQLRAIIQAEKKGYISQEQKDRYLDPNQTTEIKLESIVAFFQAVEKYDLPKRLDKAHGDFILLLEESNGLIQKDPSQKKRLLEFNKHMEEIVKTTETVSLLQELLNAEIFELPPDQVDLFIQRTMDSMEIKREFEYLEIFHQTPIKKLSTSLKEITDLTDYQELFYNSDELGAPSLLGMINKINGTPEVCHVNIFHTEDNRVIRRCVLKRFNLLEAGLSGEGALNPDNVRDLPMMHRFLKILAHYSFSLLVAVRRVFALDAETRASEENKNELGVSVERVAEMRAQCEWILQKRVPLTYALRYLQKIWQTLESNRIKAKEAQHIEELIQLLEGNVPGGLSLMQLMSKNPSNLELLDQYKDNIQKAFQKFREEIDNIQAKLRALNKDRNIPPHIREYQRQTLNMERSILQIMEELREVKAKEAERLKKEINEKQKRIKKYRAIVDKFAKEHPELKIQDLT